MAFPPPKAKRNKGKAFEVSDDDFQEAPLIREDKNIRTTLKTVKEDTSTPGPSNVVINEKTSMPAINKDTSVQALLPALTSSTSCTSAPIKTSKKYQDKTKALKNEACYKKTKRTSRVPLDKFKYITASIRLQGYQRIHNYYCQDKWNVALLFGVYFNNAAYGTGLKS